MKPGILKLLVFFFLVGITLFPANAQQPSPSYTEPFTNGQVNWTTGWITATGIGLGPNRPMALRAATVVAQRNLLEIVQGVRIDSQTVVANMMVQSDTINQYVKGFIKHSRRIAPPKYMSDGSVEVTVGMSVNGQIRAVIMPQIVPASSPAPSFALTTPPSYASTPSPPSGQSYPTAAPPPPPPSSQYSGLLIDGRGLGIRPALAPKVLDETGREIYGSTLVSREYAIQQGMVGYSKEVISAQSNPRIAPSPLLVKGIKSSGAGSTDIIISNEDAMKISNSTKASNFLEECKVMIVL